MSKAADVDSKWGGIVELASAIERLTTAHMPAEARIHYWHQIEAELRRRVEPLLTLAEKANVSFPQTCTHDEEPWYCVCCKSEWEDAQATALKELRKELDKWKS